MTIVILSGSYLAVVSMYRVALEHWARVSRELAAWGVAIPPSRRARLRRFQHGIREIERLLRGFRATRIAIEVHRWR